MWKYRRKCVFDSRKRLAYSLKVPCSFHILIVWSVYIRCLKLRFQRKTSETIEECELIFARFVISNEIFKTHKLKQIEELFDCANNWGTFSVKMHLLDGRNYIDFPSLINKRDNNWIDTYITPLIDLIKQSSPWRNPKLNLSKIHNWNHAKIQL